MTATTAGTVGLTRALAEFLSDTAYDDLPPAVVDESYRATLDWFGSALAGALEPPARIAQRVVQAFGAGDESTVLGVGRGSAPAAALANGVASHILELDDVHKGSTLHAAAPVISAALAVAEREHASGRALALAIALGYDASLRIGEAVNPSHYRYWHPTGTAATFGAAAAAASILRLTSSQMLDALGTAGTQAAGLWEFNADGAMSKHLHPGKAAFNGVLAADLARLGFTGAAAWSVEPLCTSSSSRMCDATPFARAAAGADPRPAPKTVDSSPAPRPPATRCAMRAGDSSAPASADPSQSSVAR